MNNRISKLRGSIVAIVTPFNEDGSIDYNAYENLLHFHMENGTDGIVVCGTTGETPSLTDTEYKELIRFTVKHIAGLIPVIAGSGSNSTHKALYYSQIAQEEGVDGLLIVTPYYNKPTISGLYKHFAFIAERINTPVILYNVPGRTGTNIPASLTLKLANDFGNIIAVKEASGNLIQISEILANRPEGFNVYSGDDALALSVVAQGGDGCISVVANQIPYQFAEMLRYALKGKLEEARALYNRYLELMQLNFIESNPIPVKTALSMMGYIQEYFRLPICPMEEKNKKILKQCLVDSNLLAMQKTAHADSITPKEEAVC